MTKGLVFWILMLLWIVHWGGTTWGGWTGPAFVYSGSLLLFALFFLLGWDVFGFIIR